MPFDQQNFEPAPSDAVLRVLTDARGKIEKPENWFKGDWCNTVHRMGAATAWCSWGSLHAILGSTRDPLFREALDRLNEAVPGGGIISYNDDPKTTHADVLAVFDHAIAARKAEMSQTNEIGAVASNASA